MGRRCGCGASDSHFVIAGFDTSVAGAAGPTTDVSFPAIKDRGGALGTPLGSEVALSLGSGRARSPRRIPTKIAVFGGRGPESGPVAPQMVIIGAWARPTIMDMELSVCGPMIGACSLRSH